MTDPNVSKTFNNNSKELIKDIIVEVDEDSKRCDRVVIKTTLPQPTFPFKGTLNFIVECPNKTGYKYVVDNFDYRPEVYFYSSSDFKLQTYRDTQHN